MTVITIPVMVPCECLQACVRVCVFHFFKCPKSLSHYLSGQTNGKSELQVRPEVTLQFLEQHTVLKFCLFVEIFPNIEIQHSGE